MSDDEILKSIDKRYFTSVDEFDDIKFFLENVPEETDDQYWQKEEFRYAKALQLVDQKLSVTVMSNYNYFGRF